MVLAADNRCGKVEDSNMRTPEEMVTYYTSLGGRITDEWSVGSDPLAAFPGLQRVRELQFAAQLATSFDTIFSDIVNGNSSSFRSAILLFIAESRNLAPDPQSA